MHMRDNEMSHQTCYLQFEICHDLGGYFVRARMRNNDLSDSTKKEIVAQYKNSLRSDMEEVSSMEQRYSKLVAKVDDDAFSGIVLSDVI